MKIAMIGGGYVGVVSGACFADFGVDVRVVGRDAGNLRCCVGHASQFMNLSWIRLVLENTAVGRL